jgi:hypothetical protein
MTVFDPNIKSEAQLIDFMGEEPRVSSSKKLRKQSIVNEKISLVTLQESLQQKKRKPDGEVPFSTLPQLKKIKPKPAEKLSSKEQFALDPFSDSSSVEPSHGIEGESKILAEDGYQIKPGAVQKESPKEELSKKTSKEEYIDQVVKKYFRQPQNRLFALEYQTPVDTGLTVDKIRKIINKVFELDQKELQSSGVHFIESESEYLGKTIESVLHVYKISSMTRIGHEGSTGVVYKVLNVTAGIFEALKLTRNADERTWDSLKYEFEMLREVNLFGPHPGIQKPASGTFDLVLKNQKPFRAMIGPLYENSLNAWYKNSSLKNSERIDCCRQLMESAIELWDRGIVHCDIKPLNIFVSYDGLKPVFCFGDFGSSFLKGNVRLGNRTPGYVLPHEKDKLALIAKSDEPLSSTKFFKAATNMDLFALGVTFFQILVGGMALPYIIKDDRVRLQFKGLKLVSDFDEKGLLESFGYSGALQKVIRSMCETQPKKRISPKEAMALWKDIKN